MIPDNNKSFLWLTENYPPSRGGMAQSCDRIVQGLREKGFQIHVYHFTNRKKPYATENKQNGSYSPLPVFESESHTLNLAWNHIQTKIEQYHEIIIFGGYLPIIAGPIYARLSGKSLITLIRGNDFDISIYSPRRRGLLHEAVNSSRVIGVITMDKVDKIKAMYPNANVFYTPNGIRLDEWKFEKSDLEFHKQWKKEHIGDKLCLGVIGQLKEKKGIDILLESLKIQSLKDRIFLLMIGELDEQYTSQVEESGIEHLVYPFRDRYELLKYYGACDAIVIPSHYDGMPNVLLEAGGLGIPVIGSNIDGMKDVIEHGDTGLLFNPGDTNACRDAVVQFISISSEDRITMGNRLKERIYSEFNHEKEVEYYYKILSDEFTSGILI
jgi:glycogen(starch) synthase